MPFAIISSYMCYLEKKAPSATSLVVQGLRHCTSTAAAAAKLLQSCPTLCNPIDSSPPGSPVPGILQAKTVEWVANSFSNAWKWKVKVKPLSHVRPSATPWTAASQAPPSMGFSRQEYWSGVPSPSLPCKSRSFQKQQAGEVGTWFLFTRCLTHSYPPVSPSLLNEYDAFYQKIVDIPSDQ